MSTTVRISEEAKKKFAEIRKKNTQFTTDAQLFDHILAFYDGKRMLPLQEKGKDFVQIGEMKP